MNKVEAFKFRNYNQLFLSLFLLQVKEINKFQRYYYDYTESKVMKVIEVLKNKNENWKALVNRGHLSFSVSFLEVCFIFFIASFFKAASPALQVYGGKYSCATTPELICYRLSLNSNSQGKDLSCLNLYCKISISGVSRIKHGSWNPTP